MTNYAWSRFTDLVYPNHSYYAVAIRGENMDISQGTDEDIVSYGGDAYFPDGVGTITIYSSSASDTYGGVGAWELELQLLGDGFVESIIVVPLQGQTIVTLPTQYLRANLLRVRRSGSNGTNVGTITVKHGSTVINEIQVAHGVSQCGTYTVPYGYKGYITKFTALLNKSTTTTGDFHLMVRSNIAPIYGWSFTQDDIINQNIFYDADILEGDLSIKAGDDIKVRVRDVSSSNARASCYVALKLFKDEAYG